MKSQKPIKLTFFANPGHAWLRVPHSLIEKVGVTNQISSYSYKTKLYGYLEEDCDAPRFLDAAEKAGLTLSIVDKYSENYSPYKHVSFTCQGDF